MVLLATVTTAAAHIRERPMLTAERPPPLVEMETDCFEAAWTIVIEPLIGDLQADALRADHARGLPAALKLRSPHSPEILPFAWCRFDRISVL
jgi:hypothetical protein